MKALRIEARTNSSPFIEFFRFLIPHFPSPAIAPFGPIKRGETAEVAVVFNAAPDAPDGKRIVPVRAICREDGGKADVSTRYVPLRTTIGTSVVPDDRQPKNSHLAIETPSYSADVDMHDGCLLRLTDPDGAVRLDGSRVLLVHLHRVMG